MVQRCTYTRDFQIDVMTVRYRQHFDMSGFIIFRIDCILMSRLDSMCQRVEGIQAGTAIVIVQLAEHYTLPLILQTDFWFLYHKYTEKHEIYALLQIEHLLLLHCPSLL